MTTAGSSGPGRHLYDPDAAEVRAGRQRSNVALQRGVNAASPEATEPDAWTASLAAWSIVHGFASLWITGVLPASLGSDAGAAARQMAGVLTLGPRGTGRDPAQQDGDEPAADRR